MWEGVLWTIFCAIHFEKNTQSSPFFTGKLGTFIDHLRRVELNLAHIQNHATYFNPFFRSSSLNSLQAQLGGRRNSASSLGGGGKENVPSSGFPMLELLAPPELSEETLLAPEHKEILGKLKFVCTLVDTILEVSIGVGGNYT